MGCAGFAWFSMRVVWFVWIFVVFVNSVVVPGSLDFVDVGCSSDLLFAMT